jgi:SpoVK/Ycf46/Vps4 family AAA+-type ATPase
MRTALKTADAMAPCVLFIDEIEKAMAGMASSSQCDGGTTSRTIGTLLQWMQDQTGVFVVATANDVSKLPPEMLRRGRFDQIFFVDIPDAEERVEIWKIQINNVKRDPANFDLKELSESTDGYTGAEIESVIKDGMVNAFDCGTEPTTEIFKTAIKETIPLSSTMREKIQSMRRWADGRAVNASGKQIMAEVA